MLDKLKQILDQKISDHKLEVEACLKSLDGLPMDNGNRNIALLNAQKRMVMKDKIMFHKACMTCLTDVKEDIEKL